MTDMDRKSQYFCLLLLALTLSSSLTAGGAEQCSYYQAGVKRVYWGDLHVHTAYSLDAYAYGTLNTPREAYQFARGEEIEMAGVGPVRLHQALDFAAVTDHAEWFDLMHICTDPEQSDDPYCKNIREISSIARGTEVFKEYVIPTITQEHPEATPICTKDPARCTAASLNQWQRIQQQANEANDPCEFSALIGFEWSATPAYSHSHRNLIFANANVTEEAIDYIRYPNLQALWGELDAQCRPEDGCDVIAIPHNTNMGDGIYFDVESESDQSRKLRSRYERLVEVHQEKGNSECLLPYGVENRGDCDFEINLTKNSRPKVAADFNEIEWEKMRQTYVRSLLLRGLGAYQESGDEHLNPLQLGMIGSTDGHAGAPGHVNEDQWQGSVFGLGSIERMMSRVRWNPGGLVAVWAEENTRESLFSAMKRREVYGTSGPRITLQFSASADGDVLDCGDATSKSKTEVVMGGSFDVTSGAPQFQVMALHDRAPLDKVEIIKGEWREGTLRETRIEIWSREKEGKSLCQTWSDPDFDPAAPAFWYARVLQAPTPRWSTVQCVKAGLCQENPQAVKLIQERAWASPIWYLPK
jgi:hypothetical protein